MQRHKPGDRLSIVFRNRTGASKTASLTLAEDPHIEVVAVDGTPEQRAFRDRWLGPK
jgi:hypothetical protein